MDDEIEALLAKLETAREVRSAGHIGGVVYDITSLTADQMRLLRDIVREWVTS